jgi:hypothetical protein
MTEPKPDPKPNLNEIATSANGRDITRGFIDGMPWIDPTDPVWREAGGWLGFEALLKDDQVAACFSQRRMAVVARNWLVEPGDDSRQAKKAADLVRETLEEIGWDSITDQMLHARLFGFAVAEVLWKLTPEGVRVAGIKPRDRRRFVFAPDGELKMLTAHAWTGESLAPRCFWAPGVGASHADEPYGRGLAHALYGPVWMKRQGAKFWGVHLEKFGGPTVVGHFHEGTTPEERAKLLEAAKAVITQGAVVLPEGVTLEFLEANRGGQAGYDTWMHYWDSAIAKVVLGQTMTTDDGASRAQASVHWDVRQDIVKADADLIDASASDTWVRWLVEFNYPGVEPPRISRDMSDQEDMNTRAERDERLSGIGIKLTAEAVKRVYGDDYELAPPPGGAGALLPSPLGEGPGERVFCRPEYPPSLPTPKAIRRTSRRGRLRYRTAPTCCPTGWPRKPPRPWRLSWARSRPCWPPPAAWRNSAPCWMPPSLIWTDPR